MYGYLNTAVKTIMTVYNLARRAYIFFKQSGELCRSHTFMFKADP